MRAPIAAILLSLALAGAALADRESAQFNAGRGDKALAAKKWDEAEGFYRKALEEDDSYLPAHYGIGQALIGEGKSAPAVDELRRFVDGARALSPLPPDWKALLAKADKQLSALDASGAALEKITDGYTSGLNDLAQRWLVKSPELAESLLKRVLELRPANPKAIELLAKMGKSPRSELVTLYGGKDLGAWDGAAAPAWTIVDGEMLGDANGGNRTMRNLRSFDGDIDVRMEVRLVEEYGDGPVCFAMRPTWNAAGDCYAFGILRGRVFWWEIIAGKPDRTILTVSPTDLKKPFDPKKWNTFEMRLRANEVTVLLNGDVIGKEPRPETRKDGYVGIQVQRMRLAVRRFEVEVK